MVLFNSQPKNMNFEFPDLFPAEKMGKDLDDEKKNLEQLQAAHKRLKAKIESKPEVPGWFV
jgi:hypothetical protein